MGEPLENQQFGLGITSPGVPFHLKAENAVFLLLDLVIAVIREDKDLAVFPVARMESERINAEVADVAKNFRLGRFSVVLETEDLAANLGGEETFASRFTGQEAGPVEC